MSLVIVGVGNKASETGAIMALSVGAVKGSSDALVISPITSVRLFSISEDPVDTCRGASVAIIDESMVVLRAMSLVSVGSSCVGSSVGSSGMLDGDG